MNGQAKTFQDKESDAEVMPKSRVFGKTDVRYWTERIFRRARAGVEDTHWTAQIQCLGQREQFPLGTANKAAAAAKARDIYLSLHARGWEETLKEYKPKPEEPKPEKSTFGDLIREVAATANYRMTTYSIYCAALRRIAADIAKIKASKSRFAPQGTGNKEWRARVDNTPLELLTAEAIQQWKLDYLKLHRESPTREHRAINTVNAHLRNARSLFSAKALAFAGKRLALPDPLPFSGVKLEGRRATTRYSSRIDPAALLLAAKTELYENPKRQEQFKIFFLALLCGLRKREIDTLLWRSVDLEKSVIRIERTEYFQPKSEDSAAEVDIAPELLAVLRMFKEKATGEFVIESQNPPRYHTSRANYRAEVDFQALYTWLAVKGVAARKKLHELRKECGAVIANAMGIFAASRALRHSDIRLTSQYYADKKVRITTGLDSVLA
jgi:integrase